MRIPFTTCLSLGGPAWLAANIAVLALPVCAQISPLGALVVREAIDLNGLSLRVDSYDSADSQYSTNGRYAPALAKENGDVFANAGITNWLSGLGIGTATILGHQYTARPECLQIGASGSIGSSAWVSNHFGIQPGWLFLESVFELPDITMPDTTGWLTPTGGTVVLTSVVAAGTLATTKYYPSPVPSGGVVTNYFTNWVTTFIYPVPGTYLGTVVINGNKYSYWAITNASYTYITDHDIMTYQTNSYDRIFWGEPAKTNCFVATSFSGNNIILGPNVVVALPNGLSMGGSDSLLITGTTATLIVGGTSCNILGNAVVNQVRRPQDFRLNCASTVTSVEIKGNQHPIAVVNASRANVTLYAAGSNMVDFIGALLAKQVVLNGNFSFHFDENLLRGRPLALTAPLRVSERQLQFTVLGLPGSSYAVEASPNLADWTRRVTNSSPFVFVEDPTALPQQWYRAVRIAGDVVVP